MLNKFPRLFYVLRVGALISGLYEQCYGGLYDNNISKSKSRLGDLLIGLNDFKKESIAFSSQEKPDVTPQSGDTYDFIVIGAGTAGATVATRLSEIHQVKVLLIEAGLHEKLVMDIPAFAVTLRRIRKSTGTIKQNRPTAIVVASMTIVALGRGEK